MLAVLAGTAAGVATASARAEGPSPASTRAAPREVARFALVVGVNRPVDADLRPLRYADDDASRYDELFHMLGARTYVLARLDDSTRKLHPATAARAAPPSRAALDAAVASVARDIGVARARGAATILYVLYAGHGGAHDGRGFVTLEDAHLTGADLARDVVAPADADKTHIVVDACDSYLLAYGRGPGGTRRPVERLRDLGSLAANPRVGLLLSTSTAKESHEWDGFESGVFSHEVRSALFGGADANGDGLVRYREVAAFIQRANAAIRNDRLKPDVHARPPADDDALLDLRRTTPRVLEIDGEHAGRYFLENALGVRLADVHSATGSSLRLLLPTGTTLYLRRLDEDREFVIPEQPALVSVADLTADELRARARGSTHEAFRRLFSFPFDRAAVEAYAPEMDVQEAAHSATFPPAGAGRSRRTLGFVGLGAGAAGLATGAFLSISATRTADGPPGESQSDAAARNDRVRTTNTAAAVSYAAGGALAATGLLLLLWPEGARRVQTSISDRDVRFSLETTF